MTAVLGWPLVVGQKVGTRLTALVVWADELRHGGGEPSTANDIGTREEGVEVHERCWTRVTRGVVCGMSASGRIVSSTLIVMNGVRDSKLLMRSGSSHISSR